MFSHQVLGQGYNHQWLLGYWFAPDPKGKMLFDNASYSQLTEIRKMQFFGTESNISDVNGNLLLSTNGVWIANTTGDTMMNGGGLNPSLYTNNWPSGLPIGFMNIVVPYPGDSNKFALFHQTLWQTIAPCLSGFYKTEVDLSLDGGLGGVIQKNDTLFSDTLSNGIGACKHANGRDWWIFVMRDFNPVVHTLLLTPNGIDTIFTQNLGSTALTYGNVSPLVFSQDGRKMIYCTPTNQNQNGTVLISDFDRCSGTLSNTQSINISPSSYLFGLAFSPSGNLAYACGSNYIYQIDINSLTFDTVAIYDGFISPPGSSCCTTQFWSMYLAANGKIYVTSGSGVRHLHEINYPDSAGVTCDVQQHAVDLVDYLHLRAVPNHPNYYLGCDTTSGCACLNTPVNEINGHDFRFRVHPNPITDNNLNIGYLLPTNQNGTLAIYNTNGKIVLKYSLPSWSTEQSISLPNLSDGIYNCVITSGTQRVSKKIVVLKE